jgi:hypothetical protein
MKWSGPIFRFEVIIFEEGQRKTVKSLRHRGNYWSRFDPCMAQIELVGILLSQWFPTYGLQTPWGFTKSSRGFTEEYE